LAEQAFHISYVAASDTSLRKAGRRSLAAFKEEEIRAMEARVNTTQPQGSAAAVLLGASQAFAAALGQVVWLLSQSALHRELKIKELEGSFMPAIHHEQFRIFRFGPLPGLENVDPETIAPAGIAREALEQLPLGVAIWAKLSAVTEAKLEKGDRLTTEEWRSGDRVWLVELVSPFATAQNKLSEAMLLDLMQGPFMHTPFSLHRTDAATGRRTKVLVSSHVKHDGNGGA
jgi:cytolysin-activating lysine-acyltransferase